MKISECWLREWVNPNISTDELIKVLTMAGLEVDSVEAAASLFSGIVVGEVLSTEKHPDADKLSVCKVSNGLDEFQVVCGAPNVRSGLKIPFAMVGAVLGEDFKIKKAKLRGVESHGMLCSAEELGLAEEADGLLELPADAPAGMNFREYLSLDDSLIEVDLTPNRGDCLSIAGLAREVGVLTSAPVNALDVTPVAPGSNDTFPVKLAAPNECPRYLGRVIRQINPEVETPLWMQEKLRRCGIRSIDPVVDVTNYVLLELGQPMHAFDLDKLTGSISVRMALADEKLILLDGKEVSLKADTLVIADESGPLAMAGVMGGKPSSVTPCTTNIFLECAYFSPLAVAGKARSYGLHTDSSHRYERGVDYQLQQQAMERATALLLEIVGGTPGPVTELTGGLPDSVQVSLRKARIETLLGMPLEADKVEQILTLLGLELVSTNNEGWVFAVPSWRFDISIEEDLIEELARVYGYDNLPVTMPGINMQLAQASEYSSPLSVFKHAFAAQGYQEVVTYSFVEAELDLALADVNEADVEAGLFKPVALANPISQDMAVMRSSLLPGLVKTLIHNQNRQQSRIRLFESGLSFVNKNNVLEQKLKVACLLWGSALPEQWGAPSRDVDFFDLKGDIENLLQLTHSATEFSFECAEHNALQPGQTARIMRSGESIGWIGALHPKLMQALDLTGKVYIAELDVAMLSKASVVTVSDISRFPAVRRDLALLLPEAVKAMDVEKLLMATAGEVMQEVTVFDLYQGDSIEKGKKSLALGLTFQHPSRTLADSDINPIIDSCINALQAKFNAELR